MMETEEERSENRMGTQPIGKLLFTMAFPLIISMLVQAFYNIVDSLYVSRLNQAAFNAVSLSYPIQNIMSAIASGTGIGLVALISRSLGEKDYKKADLRDGICEKSLHTDLYAIEKNQKNDTKTCNLDMEGGE